MRSSSVSPLGWGGEFLLCLHVADADEGRGAIDQVHERVNALMADSGLGAGFSTGAIILDPGMAQIGASQIEAADRLMYMAKQEGRCSRESRCSRQQGRRSKSGGGGNSGGK